MADPGYIDAHCHILPAGLDLLKLDLSAANSVEEVLGLIGDWNESRPDGWLLARGYDDNRYGRHLTRNELDLISTDRPIALRHVSGHAGVANSAALASARIREDVTNPQGGRFVRDESGRLNGVLLERAWDIAGANTPKPTFDQMVEAILAAGESMARWGIVAASDMQTGSIDLEAELGAYREAANRGCAIAMTLYVQWSRLFGPNRTPIEGLADYGSGRCRIAGVKIFADGALSTGTAAIYGSFPDGSSGTLIYRPERLTQMVVEAAEAGYQVAVHSIGDRCTDHVLDAFEATPEPSRHRIEHAMMLSDSQIERLARVGCHVVFQPEFLLRLSHAYLRQLGPERASRLNRIRSTLDAGARVAFSSDRPVVPGNPADGIAAAVNRPSGFDPDENCSREQAQFAYTVGASRATETS